ncbi:cytochrome o ubiquinol oxidase subunit IV [Novosphingobium sp.]|uniref:cytochrome o ubiquinol oxidase subunit IV n=1 Tax=Novosphingobium sp. TaxID=1874826 RepID=UPI003B52FA1B
MTAAHSDSHEPAKVHEAAHVDDVPHFSLKHYGIGFGLSVVLTAIPFWLVMSGVLGDKVVTALIIAVFAAAQVGVHMIFFLHLNTKSQGGWNFLALVFTIIVVGTVLFGSLWVMYHLNTNMMPGMPGMHEQP